MYKYEQDLIYKILPNLNDSIEHLANAIDKYNSNKDVDELKLVNQNLYNINETLKYLK